MKENETQNNWIQKFIINKENIWIMLEKNF